MSSADALLRTISLDLRTGMFRVANLGQGAPESLDLNQPGALAKYASLMRPTFERALRENRRARALAYSCLGFFFVAALAITVAAHIKGSEWIATATVVPGFGVACVWPVAQLIRLNRQNLALSLLPDLLPLLSKDQAAHVAEHILAGA